MIPVPAATVREQISLILTAWGMRPEDVRITADVMVETDLAGVDSHGLQTLTMYEELRSLGHLNFAAQPRVVRDGPAAAAIDADNGLGHPVAVMAMKLAMEKARRTGIGAVTVFNSAHFGACGYYTELATREGLLGMVMTTTRLSGVVPTLSARPALGTNPIAFAAPARRNRAFSLDMSTSTTAINKIKVMALKRDPLPPGWVLDGEGKPITDAAAAMDYLAKTGKGGMSPVGGTPEMASHKGYGLALVVQILAGTLGGGSFSPLRNRTQKKNDPDNIGHFFLAIDPKAFRGEGDFEADLDAAIDYLHGLEPIDPDEPVLVPGDPEANIAAERGQSGIPVAEALVEQVRGVCQRCGAAFILTRSGP